MREFMKNVVAGLQEKLSDCEITTMVKDLPNGLKREGVVIKRSDSNMAPTIYLDEFHNAGMSVEETIDRVVEIYNRNKVSNIDIDWFKDFERVKPKLRARLYNKRTKAEVFKSADEFGFSDLIIIPYVNVSFIGMEGSIKIAQNHLDVWGVSVEEVVEIAMSNTAKLGHITSLAETLAEKTGMPIEYFKGEGPDVLIATIKDNGNEYGAISAITCKSQLMEIFPDGFYVIPSSIYEVLIVPAEIDSSELDNMIKEINVTTVDSVDVLSDHAYLMTA